MKVEREAGFSPAGRVAFAWKPAPESKEAGPDWSAVNLGTLVDRAGMPVNASAARWRLNSAGGSTSIDWARFPVRSRGILSTSANYIARLVETFSPDEVANNFSALCLLFRRSGSFREADDRDEVVPYVAISEARESLGTTQWRLQFLPRWYRFGVSQGCRNFSAEVAHQLEKVSFGHNSRAEAVRSLDPARGPLIDAEIHALLSRLRAARANGGLSHREEAALWLSRTLGANALQYVLLFEQDLARLDPSGAAEPLYTLRVPRMKKRDPRPRTQFKEHKLVPELGHMLERLIADNASMWAENGGPPPAGIGRPIFARATPELARLNGPMREFAYALRPGDFTNLVSRAVVRLQVVSPRTGKLLSATSRRFRYTKATRLVRDGASPRVVAEALDHSDTQSVQCYFDLKSDVVESLDRAMAMALAPRAQAFLGKVVSSEKAAARGEDSASRIYGPPADRGSPPGVGTCGSFAFCGLAAPVACYTCSSFQPWMDGPHEQVLKHLLDERAQKIARGLDERMAAVNDYTILAVADVIQRIEAAVNATDGEG